MAYARGRSMVLLIYSILALQGLSGGGSGFLFLFTLQLDLLGMIALYILRPQRVRRSKDPDGTMLFVGSVPIILLNYVLAVGLGMALDEYQRDGPGSFLDKPVATFRWAMIALSVAYVVVVVLDRIYYEHYEDLWPDLPSRMAIKGTLIASMGYVAFGLLFWFGEENKFWVIPCLTLVRIALEYVLKPLPGAPKISKR